MKKYLTSLNIVFGLEVVVVVLAAIGLVPREAILAWTGIAVFYIIFSPIRDSLWLIVASIPIFAALPISEGLDTLANWRILIAVLSIILFFKEGVSLKINRNERSGCRIKGIPSYRVLEYLASVFLFIGLFSVFVADYKILALKKLLFLINIFLLFWLTRKTARSKEEVLRVWRAMAVGGVAAIGAALIQFVSVLFVSLINFWQFWAGRVINFFYGQGLADLLSYSNTWFAYYNSAPPTLRLFSVFPDSHSFAMFSLLLVPIFSCLALYYQQKNLLRNIFGALGFFALFGAVFSGSRGVWLSALPVIAVLIYFWFRKTEKSLLKPAFLSLLSFALAFFISVGYPSFFYKVQDWRTGHYSSSTMSIFERAKSISDLEETSNKGRLEIWRNSFLSIKDRPMLGVGPGNFITVIGEEVGAVKKGASAHNLYLDVAAEFGLLGLAVLLAMFAHILLVSQLVWHRSQEAYFKLFGLLFGLYFIWILGYSFFDVVLLNDKVLLLFAVSAATLYSLRSIILSSNKK